MISTNALAVRPERSEGIESNADAPSPQACTIGFRNVSFAYPNRPPVLTDFNLRIETGETIALTGENGAGKARWFTCCSGSSRRSRVRYS